MKHLITILLLISTVTLCAQFTAIPDANFEQELINLGLDAIIDGQVITANIDTLTNLDVSNLNIADLTGIQAFTSLTNLDCDGNLLTQLDVTQNTALVDLGCDSNQISSLDLSQNLALIYLGCEANNLGALDLSSNGSFRELDCSNNQFLSCLNINNGNNINVTFFYAINCGFSCVKVDSILYSVANWINIDNTGVYDDQCSICGFSAVDELSVSTLNIYPNPTTKNITITSDEVLTSPTLSIRNSLGQIVLKKKYNSTNQIELDLEAPPGIYFLQLEIDGQVITKKIIKQ